MLSTSYLKTSKSSICRTSSKTGIHQTYYIRPPLVSTQTVKYRIHYRVAVDLGNAPQGVAPLSPLFWSTKYGTKLRPINSASFALTGVRKGLPSLPAPIVWAWKGLYSVSILFSVFCTLWAYCCSIVCVYTTTFLLKTINLHLSLDYPFDTWVTWVVFWNGQ